jgi:hypothetical protein
MLDTFLHDLIAAAEDIVFETTGQHVFRDGHTGAFTEEAGTFVASVRTLAVAEEDRLTMHLWDEGIVRPEATALEAVRALFSELGMKGRVVDQLRRRSSERCEPVGLHVGPMGSIELDADIREKFIAELGGRNLACSCPIGSPCHVDVLVEHANPGVQ